MFNKRRLKDPIKINKPLNEIGSRPKLEPWHKQAQGPTKIKMKQVAQTKWGVYIHDVRKSWNVEKQKSFSALYGDIALLLPIQVDE